MRDVQVDGRVIAASNRDLERAVKGSTFGQDSYYRLGYYLDLPPSAACRKEGILPPLEYFIDRYNRKFRKPVQGITKESRTLMMKYDWPGNVRELKNERAMILEESTSSTRTTCPSLSRSSKLLIRLLR